MASWRRLRFPRGKGQSHLSDETIWIYILLRHLQRCIGIQPARSRYQITCPLLITEPANEVYWLGQSRQLYDLVKSPKALVHFPENDGADLHCEPKGTGLRDLHVFNWLDQALR